MLLSPSSRLGLRGRGRKLLSVRATGPASIFPQPASWRNPVRPIGVPVPTTFPFTTSQPRLRAPGTAPTRTILEQAERHQGPAPSPKLYGAQNAHRLAGEASGALSLVLPGTFVLPPLSEFPKSVMDKLKLLYYCVLQKAHEIITNRAVSFGSKPTFFARARFKPKRSALIPTAKALHRTMAEALAAGDRDTINRICSATLAAALVASVDARAKSRRYGWELLRYTKKAFYPSIKSHRLAPMGRERNAPIIRQAVVSISSRQRRFQYDARGQVVPGTEKEIEAVENLVIGCVVDPRTWTQSEWLVMGVLKPTTLGIWKEEEKMLKLLLQE